MSEGGGAKILIVEDDKRLSYGNRRALESEGYQVQAAYTLGEARDMLGSVSPDVILLDVKLPDGSGFDLCREIRDRTSAHIIFLTSIQESSGEMEGLVAGGDDYLRKPYDIALLRERVKKGLRRTGKLPQAIKRDSLTLDLLSGQAFVDGADLLLTQKEFSILLLLVQNEGQPLGMEYVYEKIWGRPMNKDANAVKNQISNLRKKLAGSGYTVSATRGEGYCFEPEE